MTNFLEMSINERIDYLIKDLRMNANSFAVRLDASDSLIRNITSKKSKPGYDTLVKIVRTYNLESDWILLGIGEIYRNGNKRIPSEDLGRPIDEVLAELELYKKREKAYLKLIDSKTE